MGVAEEYVPGENVVEDNGVLRSLVVGRVERDDQRHAIRIAKLVPELALPRKGGLVYAVATDVKPKMVTVDIVSVDDKPLSNSFLGLIPVSMIDERRVESAEECFVSGDVVLCRVMSDKAPYVLTTKGQELGVVKAKCRECGEELYRSGGMLVCLTRGHRDTRKMSSGFALVTDRKPVYDQGQSQGRGRIQGRGQRRERVHSNTGRRSGGYGGYGGTRYGDRRNKLG